MLRAAFSSLSNRHPQGANMGTCGRGETRCAPTCEPWHRSRNSFGSYQRDEQQQLSPPTFYQTVLARCGTCTKQHRLSILRPQWFFTPVANPQIFVGDPIVRWENTECQFLGKLFSLPMLRQAQHELIVRCNRPNRRTAFFRFLEPFFLRKTRR